MAYRKTSVLINEALADEVRDALHTTTLKATIEGAFLEVLRARARREEIEAMSRLDGLDLADPATMQGAWRR